MFESVAVHNESVEKDYFCHYIVSIDVMGNLFPVFLGNNISVRTISSPRLNVEQEMRRLHFARNRRGNSVR